MRRVSVFAAALLAAPLAAQSSGPIDPARMTTIVRDLTDPSFEGRAPGTPGEARTTAYLERSFRALGLAPAGADGSYLQDVPLVHTRIVGTPVLSVAVGGGAVPLSQGQSVYVSTVRDTDRIRIDRAPMVFVGYGVAAPERHWDDFKGVDLRGKVAVVLVNDPDFEAQSGEPGAGSFGGRRMTYYGRWTYKYDELAKRGAVATLIVHDTAGAGYGWSTVIAPGGENYDIVRATPTGMPIRGWIAADAAADLFRRAGLDLSKLKAAARRADFRPVAIGDAMLNVDAQVSADRVVSHNVLAKIAGSTRPQETILFGAHWDAYGVGAPDTEGRTIRPGAADDAVGVAGVLELARAFKAAPAPQRTLVFGLWTAEERGLLGSEAYAAHPSFLLAKTVAALTIDVLETAGPAHDVVLVGDGQSDLEDRLAAAARAQGRTITPEALPERGLYFRADHFSVARRGVPSLLLMGMSGGHDLVAGGRAAGDAWLADYMKCYHQPCDMLTPKWDLRGAAQDVALYYTVGTALANGRDWPDWRAGSEFKAIRARSAAERR